MLKTASNDLSLIDDRASLAEAEAMLRMLAHQGRLLVLCNLVEQPEIGAGELARRVGLSQSALSQHLARLRDEGLVATRKDAQSVFYRIADPRVERIIALLHDLYCPDLSPEKR